MEERIAVKLQNNIVMKTATLQDYIDDEGVQFTMAYAGNNTYKIIERDFEKENYKGHLWSIC